MGFSEARRTFTNLFLDWSVAHEFWEKSPFRLDTHPRTSHDLEHGVNFFGDVR